MQSEIRFKVPCNRAYPKKDGSPGLHEVRITIENNVDQTYDRKRPSYVKNITSDCCTSKEEEEGLSFFTRPSCPEAKSLCYYYVNMVKNTLKWGTVRDGINTNNSFFYEEAILPYRDVLKNALQSNEFTQRARESRASFVRAKEGVECLEYLTKVAQKVTTTDFACVIKEDSEVWFWYNGATVAKRNETGGWTLVNGFHFSKTDGVLMGTYGARNVHNTGLFNHPHNSEKICVICGASYKRYDGHTDSLIHQKASTEMIKVALKATSKRGLARIRSHGYDEFMTKNQQKFGRFQGLDKSIYDTLKIYISKDAHELGYVQSYVEKIKVTYHFPFEVCEHILETSRNRLYGKKEN